MPPHRSAPDKSKYILAGMHLERKVTVFYGVGSTRSSGPHVLSCTYENRRRHQRGIGILPVENNPRTYHYSELPSQSKKRRGGRNSSNKKAISTSPARSTDLGIIFKKSASVWRRQWLKYPPPPPSTEEEKRYRARKLQSWRHSFCRGSAGSFDHWHGFL